MSEIGSHFDGVQCVSRLLSGFVCSIYRVNKVLFSSEDDKVMFGETDIARELRSQGTLCENDAEYSKLSCFECWYQTRSSENASMAQEVRVWMFS